MLAAGALQTKLASAQTALPAIDLECEISPACAAGTRAVARIVDPQQTSIRNDQVDSIPARGNVIPAPSQARTDRISAPEPSVETAAVDVAALQARDARMLATLTRQLIEHHVTQGLGNDGETTAAEREAAEAFYAARAFQPLFLEAGALNARGTAIIGVFTSADEYGLEPADFVNPAFLEEGEQTGDAAKAALADINMALWALRYARHAQTGRVNPATISADITLDRNLVDPGTVLPALVDASDTAEALLGFHPQHDQFRALRLRLAELRSESADEQYIAIPEGGTLRVGDRDDRVPLLRERLGVPAPEASSEEISRTGEAQLVLASSLPDETGAEGAANAPDVLVFDEALDRAVRDFQASHNLVTDGIVGPATFSALNAKSGDLVPHIIANMERWRWMPRELGRFHVLANVPEYRLWVMQDGESIFTTRTIVGRNRHRTAIFSDEMEYLAVNPYWNVPSSITRSELLPNILANPGYLPARNYEVLYNGRVIDPYAVNWQAVADGAGSPRIRQRPGPRNALGEIKFMFPNQHAIYFHDTPSRGLFGRDRRSFSHGCVRVQDPWAFAEALLENEPDWNLARLRSLKGPRERTMLLDQHIPVHITYFTARVDDDGDLIMSNDLYGHHGRVLAALGLDNS
ncbi:MAG: L,D-transpeptidase family protein [Pseudomonadota bacterium]